METKITKIVDYRKKIQLHVDSWQETDAVNAMINFFNRCFTDKNNFLIPDFNQKQVKYVQIAYNQLKTNILSIDCNTKVFDMITNDNLKLFKFIMFRLKLNYNVNQEYLSPIISYEQLSIIIGMLNSKILK